MKGKRWTKRDDVLLLAHTMHLEEIAELLGRRPRELQARAGELGVDLEQPPAVETAPPTPILSPAAENIHAAIHDPDPRPGIVVSLRLHPDLHVELSAVATRESIDLDALCRRALRQVLVRTQEVLPELPPPTCPLEEMAQGRTSEGMSEHDATVVARRVLLQLYRGSIEQARHTLEEGWQAHLANHAVLPIGPALLDEPLARVIADVRVLNYLETIGVVTVGKLIEAPDTQLRHVHGIGETHLERIRNLKVGLQSRAGIEDKPAKAFQPPPIAIAPLPEPPAQVPPANQPQPRRGRPKKVPVSIDRETRAWCETETLRLLPLVLRIVRKLNLPLPEEDLVQEGALACFEALPRFDPNRGFKLETFVAWRIRGGILDYARKAGRLTSGGARTGRKEQITSLDQVLYTTDTDHEQTQAHFLEDTKAIDPRAARGGERSAAICKGMDVRERIILQEYFAHGKTMKQIGQSLALSESRVSQLTTGLLARLRALDEQDGRVRENCA